MNDLRIYTPTELNREIKLHLEAGFSRICLEAEISNLSRPASGHLYFSLKDDRAQVRCALFRSAAARLGVQPENGMKVLARGRISLYEARGDYQMIVDSLQHAGEGLLQQKFEELKKKLEGEGLFEASRKRPLPAYPTRIALVTSPSGAVVRDMLHVLKRRWPAAQVRIYPVPVQGDEAPPAIISALAAANRHAWADVILMGRGGGSLEDLWAFNDEGVARAVAASALPLVSAVGHETDFSISDFVADLRAPTPSAAAELSTPDAAVLKQQFARFERQLQVRMEDRKNRAGQRLDYLAHRLQQAHPQRRLDEQRKRLAQAQAGLEREIRRSIDQRRNTLRQYGRQLEVLHPARMIATGRERLRGLAAKLNREAALTVRRHRERVSRLAGTLNAISPLQTVGRGYALLTSGDDHQVVSRLQQVPQDGRITALISDARLQCRVESSEAQEPAALFGETPD